VVEARERSGALITADLALEEGREVFAVPGEITSRLSAGTNALLRLGATPVTSVLDVLERFGLEPTRAEPEPTLDPRSKLVYEALRDGPASADELARATRLPASALSMVLTFLELTGLVVEGEGAYRVVMPSG
jgi:DNA processing protein